MEKHDKTKKAMEHRDEHEPHVRCYEPLSAFMSPHVEWANPCTRRAIDCDRSSTRIYTQTRVVLELFGCSSLRSTGRN